MYQLELMAFRQGDEGLEVLIQHKKKWQSILSALRKAAWDKASVEAEVSSRRGAYEGVRYAGDYETPTQDMAQVFCMLVEDVQDMRIAQDSEMMWVNTEVLIQKIVHRPEKFAPQLLETLTTALKSFRH
ncbi:MAG: hypothetical protein LCH26_02115 [Proteobacteria bacterium]|nr:hypothetical protein [Pseudomonadota bacterium]